MRVHEITVVDLESGAVEYDRSFAYEGPVARCESFGIAEAAMVVGALASVGTAAYEISNTPKAPDNTPKEDPAKLAEQQAYAEANAIRKRQGMSSTILTGPGGTSMSAPTRKTTLGD
jgi:hypothetical protein